MEEKNKTIERLSSMSQPVDMESLKALISKISSGSFSQSDVSDLGKKIFVNLDDKKELDSFINIEGKKSSRNVAKDVSKLKNLLKK